MRTQSFPIFQSHLDLAHSYWTEIVQNGDSVIDATCGNGQDTWKLCQLALTTHSGKVYAFDIQEEAILSTHEFLQTRLHPLQKKQVCIQKRCHSSFPHEIKPFTIKLVVYNLGYLPKGDKSKTTKLITTIKSLKQAQELLQPGGVISVTCYPGHREGAEEQEALVEYVSQLTPKNWNCCHHLFLNRNQSPSLILIQKNKIFESEAVIENPQQFDSKEEDDQHH